MLVDSVLALDGSAHNVTFSPTATAAPVAQCYKAPATNVLVFGFLLFVGIFLAYVPQMIKLISLRSNLGLSLWTTVLASASNACSLFDALNQYWNYFYCCMMISPWQCITILLVILNYTLTWFCWHAIYILALVFWPDPAAKDEKEKQSREKYTHLFVFLGYMVFMILGFVAIVLGTTVDSFKQIVWFNTLLVSGFGIISAGLTLLIWVPQIYTTYVLKGSQSLSLIMMIVLTPGSFVNLYYQIGMDAKFWIWIPTALAGFFQCVLCCMMVYFTYISPPPVNIMNVLDDDGESTVTESDSLINT